jgi:hypothetical protein
MSQLPKSPRPDPDSTANPVLYLRAEGPLGLLRSVLVVVGCLAAGGVVIAGSLAPWWLIVVIPLGLFNLVEVIGYVRYRRLPPPSE